MPFRVSSSAEDFLFPGWPVAVPIGQAVLSSIGFVSDSLVVGGGTEWERLVTNLPEQTSSKWYIVDQGADFVSRVIGLASTGLRVTAFSTPADAEHFLRVIAQRPFPLAAVVHAPGYIDPAACVYGFQLSASTPQESVDFALLAQRASEEALVPGVCSHLGLHDLSNVGTLLQPEGELPEVWLGHSQEMRPTRSPAQEMLFGKERRRIPAAVDLDQPVGIGSDMTTGTESISRAGIGPFFMDTVPRHIDRTFEEFGALTGRNYSSVASKISVGADYMVLTDGPADVLELYGRHVAAQKRQRLGVVRLTLPSPFPETEVARLLKGCKSVTVLETDSLGRRHLATLVRASLHRSAENGSSGDLPKVFEARLGSGRILGPADAAALVANMLPGGTGLPSFDVGISFAPGDIRVPSFESLYQTIRRAFPGIEKRGLAGSAVDIQLSKKGSSRKGRTIVLAGTDTASVSAVSESFAAAGFAAFKQPAATSLGLAASTAGETVYALASIGSVSPVTAEIGQIDAIMSTRHDELVRWLSDPRLAEDAVLYLPAAQLPGFANLIAGKSGMRSIRVHSVDLGPDISESQTLVALVSGWMKSDSISKADWDAFSKGFLTNLADRMSWNRDEQTSASNLLVGSEGVSWVPSGEDQARSAPIPEPVAPSAIRQAVERTGDLADAGRFWQTVGYSFSTEQQDRLSPDPYISSNTIPARTGSFRSGLTRLDRLPELYPENCTGCGACAAFCPEGALRTAAQSIETLVEYGIGQVRLAGKPTVQLDRIAGPLAKKAHRLVKSDELQQYQSMADILKAGLEPVLEAMKPAEETKRELLDGFDTLLDAVGAFPVIRTETYFDSAEVGRKGSGQLFLLGVNPDSCTSCGLCESVCPDDALGMHAMTDEHIAQARMLSTAVADVQPDFAPSTAATDSPGSMNFLMGRKPSEVVLGSDRAYPGSGSKLTLRLVCSLIEAEQVPRYAALVEEAGDLIESVRNEINDALHAAVDVNDFEAFGKRLDELKREHVSAPDLADLVAGVSEQTIDSARLGVLTASLSDLESLRRDLGSGRSGDGRARMAAVFGSGSLLAKNRPFPFNPYPFPWIHLEQGSPISVAEGLFEGLMSQMCAMFATLRRAGRLAKGLDVADHSADPDSNLSWTDLTSEEWLACPPVCVFTQDEADIPRSWLKGSIPINVFILDGNEALADEGWGSRLWPLARPDWFVLHSTAAAFEHFSQGVRAGLGYRGPAIFRLYTPEPRLHGFRPDQTVERMLAAVKARAFPLIRYNPDPDREWTDRWSLAGNANPEDDWVSSDNTPAHWMAAEGRFQHFFMADPDQEPIDQVELHERFAASNPDDKIQTIVRLPVDGREVVVGISPEGVEASRSARAFWRLLQELAGIRSSALARAREEASAEIETQVEAARTTIEAKAQAEVDRVTSEHTAIYHEKLKLKLLALSGFGPGTDAHERKLTEYTESE